MGACATKPKDLKGEAPEDAPENVPAAEVAASTKEAGEVISKDVVVVAEEEVKKEIQEGGGADDDDADRRRSLSNLFKEVIFRFSIFNIFIDKYLYLFVEK